MNTSSSRRRAAREPSPSLSASLAEQLATLYGLAQRSDHVFGSPLGPFEHAGRAHYVPRFVYVGPHTSDESPRLAFLAGWDHRDLRSTLALLQLVGELVATPSVGQSLHLAFYPCLDVLGAEAGPRRLATQSWTQPSAPEIGLLARDARLRQYHAFIRVVSAPADDVVVLRLRTGGAVSSFVPLLTSSDVDPFPVRWEMEAGTAPAAGPLSLAADLPFQPLDLEFGVPVDWSLATCREAVTSVLKRFIVRYRAFLAYGQHL
ncbi:MAG: hypothetical protein JNG83_14580 [Opitutaceae bacterium]|nr:hypothetical protein [Opitutaceae bacterium]